MFDKMRQLMDMGRLAKEAESRLEEVRVEKSALGGRLAVVLTGNHHVVSLTVDDSLLDPRQRTVLEKALAALLTEAGQAVRREGALRAMEVLKGLDVPSA